jgi:hypothetical protein
MVGRSVTVTNERDVGASIYDLIPCASSRHAITFLTVRLCFATRVVCYTNTSGFRLHQRRRLTVLPMLATRFVFSNTAFVSWWDVGLLFRVA